MTDALNNVQMGVLAVDALGTIATLLDGSGVRTDELGGVLFYLGCKLKADMARLDGLVCESGVLAKGVRHV
jgi:hypothetical protein